MRISINFPTPSHRLLQMRQSPTNLQETAMPLSGVNVLDLTRVLSGPFCTALLGDMGADIIKVEAPEGDSVRGQGAIKDGLSWYFAQFNRNKRSLRLDMRKPEAKAILARLIGQ